MAGEVTTAALKSCNGKTIRHALAPSKGAWLSLHFTDGTMLYVDVVNGAEGPSLRARAFLATDEGKPR